MQPEVWIPIALSCVMAIVAIITLARNGKKDTQDDAVQKATMTADLKYIRDGIDEMKVDNRAMKRDIGDLKIKVTEIEQSVKSAHKRLDDMKKG
jgi:hypothetical protein